MAAGHNVTWHLKHGPWWAVQWCRDGWYSLGIHLETKTRTTWRGPDHEPVPYGPYVDLHVGWLILSVGRNPAYAGELEASTSVSRGGIRSGGS